MTATDWRTHATEANQQRFADAQARLDEDDYPPGEVGDKLRAEDQRFTDWYDAAVNQCAQDEFERQGEAEEFARRWPEPPDGARIEFEADGGRLYGAFRENSVDDGSEERRWYLYGSDDPVTWRYLVHEYRLPVDLDGVTLLVSEEDEAELVAGVLDGAADNIAKAIEAAAVNYWPEPIKKAYADAARIARDYAAKEQS